MINNFTNDYAFLSNYYECPVIYDGLRFCSAEAAYHAQKEKQRECEFIFLSPDDARHLSRTLTNIRPDWDDVKLDIMYDIVKAKFIQNPDLKEKLLITGGEHLEEEGWWNDQYWGVYQGKGENHLGKILMQIREEFKIMKKIYLASSFAYEDKVKTEERKANMKLVKELLTEKGFDVYNPSELKIPNAWDYSYWDWGDLVFKADHKEIDSSDLVVFISYGKENNAGSVWEVGYAYAINKPIIMISMNPDSPESLMVIHSAWACVDGLRGLFGYDFDNMPRTRIERIES